jgi:plasmid stabilization system protein ParE
VKQYPVKVSYQAKSSLKEIVSYIKKDSPMAANRVRKELINILKSLKNPPERYPKEKLLKERNKNYRSAIKWNYKIVYLFSGNQVEVLDIIHTSRNPEELKRIK